MATHESPTQHRGRVALVTGGGQGLGRAIALRLALDGARVAIAQRDPAPLERTAAEIRARGGEALAVPTDVAVPEQVARLVGAVREWLGPVDILVNNAGGVVGQTGKPLEDVPPEDWHAVVDANLTSAYLCTRAVIPGMKARGWGRIVNISSAAGLTVSRTGIQAYASAKAGQIGLTRQLAAELGPFGITVNCIAPGFILSTPTTQIQWDGYGPEGQAQMVAGISMRRLGQPEDIAAVVAFLAGPDSGWISGQNLAADGGLLP